ncbi:MAG: type III-B CRISPR module RAMP protein Cmr6 [Nitrososphaerota archaeon]
MVDSINIFGYKLDEFNELLDKYCKDPVTLCRLGVFKLIKAKDVKRELLKKLIEIVNEKYSQSSFFINRFLDSLEEGLKQHYEQRLGGAVFRVKARAVSRLIIHSRNDTSALLFEYGTILHPIFGIPYIPASSLKGVVRSYLESIPPSELSLNSIDELLGNLGQASSVVFTDGYPSKEGEKGRILEPEVTTSIYQESIKEHKAKPTPIIYPAVARGVEFTFFVAAKKEAVKYFDKMKGYVKTVIWEGVGAKTMLGYGELEVGR